MEVPGSNLSTETVYHNMCFIFLSSSSTDDSHYTHFHISTAVFESQEDLLHIRSHSRSCHACPVKYGDSFLNSPHHFDSIIFPSHPLCSLFILCISHSTCLLCMQQFSGTRSSASNESCHLYLKLCENCFLLLPFHFLIHLSSHHSVLCSLSY
jgi:hypothetical protein